MYNSPTHSSYTRRALQPGEQQEEATNDIAAAPGDDSLITRTLAGDHTAFETLVERYKRPVYRLALRLLANPADAEDAAQEAFVRSYVRLSSYKQGTNFKAWLLAITAHWCIDQRRRRKTISIEAIQAEGMILTHGEEPEARFLKVEWQREVRSRLTALPEHYRQVLVLRYWHGLSYAEVGRALDEPTSTVRMRLFRAHRRLAREGGEVGHGA